MPNLMVVAVDIVGEISKEELLNVVATTTIKSQEYFVVVTKPKKPPGFGGNVYFIQVKTDGTEALVARKNKRYMHVHYDSTAPAGQRVTESY